MKKMSYKFLLCIALLICFPMISSQEWVVNTSFSPGELNSGSFESVEIVSGITLEAVGEIETEILSEKGAMINSFQNLVSNVINFLGLNIYDVETIEAVESFELIACPAGTQPFTSLSYGDVFAESESIIIPDRTTTENIFVTNNVQVEVTGDIFALPFDSVQTDFGVIRFTNWIGENALYSIDGIGEFSTLKLECGLNHCPTVEQIAENFPNASVLMNYVVIPEFENMVITVLKLDAAVYEFIILDSNNNGVWEFNELIDSYSTLSHEANSLIILDSGFYDVYMAV